MILLRIVPLFHARASLWQHGPEALQEFQDHLNQQEPSIQFTMEQEEEGEILFLNALVERDHNKLTTSVYPKPIHTDRYLHFRSHHYRRVLTGIVRCLKNRTTKCAPNRNNQTNFTTSRECLKGMVTQGR